MNIQERGKGVFFLTVNAGKNAKGRYIRRTKTVHCKTKTEAKTEWAKFKTEVEAGEYIAPEKMTLSAFVGEWRVKYADKHLANSTQQTYIEFLTKRVLPVFGHKRLDEISTFELVSFFESAAATVRRDKKKGYISSSTLQIIYRAIRNVFTRATEWRIIKTNPMLGVKKPKEDTAEMNVYDKSETELLFIALENEPINWRNLIMLTIISGLRQGEILGLEWNKHIDLDAGIIEVSQALSYTKDHGYEIKEPKTRSSRRKISNPSPLVQELREYKTFCNKQRLKAADLWDDGDRFFVFTGLNGKPLHPSSVKTWWRRFFERHPSIKRIRFHDLRHTSATIMLSEGVNLKAISKRLGHSKLSVTESTYLHVLHEVDKQAGDKFSDLFSKKRPAN
jgi:integrase